jgi:hypothetical protein
MKISGPFLLTKVLKDFCNDIKRVDGIENKCGNFTILPISKCFPINYGGWRKVFEDNEKDFVLKTLNETGAYFLHVWNKMQDFDKTTFELSFDSDSAYIYLAKKHCPKVYQTVVKYF